MNKLVLGLSDKTECLLQTDRPFLWIGEEAPHLPRATYFDVHKHSFNPLTGIDHKKARDLATLLYALSPEGENTLTVRNGRRALAKMLLNASRLDRVAARSDEETDAAAMVADVLFSPVLKRIFCGKPNFNFSPHKTVVARISRAELGDFDALILGNCLMRQYQGQIVVPDFGFYGRDLHRSLITENRLSAGVNFLAELPVKLSQALVTIKDKMPRGTTAGDARELAEYTGLIPGTTAHTDFLQKAIEG